MERTGAAIIALLIGAVLFAMFSCKRGWAGGNSVETVSFVIPDGFRGAFVLEEDASAPPAPLSRTGGPIYTVPETGTLRVRSAAPLRDWHSATAAFVGGEPLAVEHIGPIAPYHDYTVKLRSLFSDSQGRIFFLVGTEAEQACALKDRANMKLGEVTGQR